MERPSSVVKELVENSLDAGAREVMVDIEKGGVNLIRVTDDGCGMTQEDALLSLERHATSKLRTSADLANILTLGFRGEAVPSIASVAKFRMLTRRADALTGTELVVDGGKLRDVKEAGGAPGTVIEARNLFFNMPARRKFMRAESTESAHVEQQLRLHALAAPAVRFRFRKDDRLVFDLPGVSRTADRVRQLLGTELGSELVEIPETMGSGMQVFGFILPAQHARKGRRHQFVFLNGRPIEDAAVSKGLAEGFRGNLQDGFYPAAWLWIEMEPHLVDVNVHPAKKEVRFHRPHEIRDLVCQAVVEGLKPRSRAPLPLPERDGVSVDSPVPSAEKVTARGPMFHASQQEWVMSPKQEVETETRVSKAPDFRLIGMLQERYVILESDSGLVLFDPKAARERIIFERLTMSRKEGMDSQNLLVPVLMEMDPRDLDVVLREKMNLLEAGLEVEAFGGNTLQLRSVPSFLQMDDPKVFLHEILEEALHGPASAGRFVFERIARIIANQAAKRVVPRLIETRGLLDELFECDLPYCAADGRPTLTEFNRKDIDRRFGVGRG